MQVAAFKLRNFPDSVPGIAQDWYDNPVQRLAVTRLSEYSPSADGACRASFGDGSVGFVKPRPDHAGSLVVCNEKIAADLGHVLHLPVAPVVVREVMVGTEWVRMTSMSLACLAAGRHWGDGPLAVSAETAAGLEALRVFWTWIGDEDHSGHPANLLYEMKTGGPQFLAIDHSYAFGHGGGEALTFAASGGYGAHDHEIAGVARLAAIADIEALDWRVVERIVNRLVGKAMSNHDGERILRWLETRRSVLRSLLKVGAANG